MIIKIKKFHPDAVIPAFQTAGAACVDVVATEITQKPFNKVIVKLGFGLDLPEGYKACIVPRSSFTHQTFVLANSPTQMDSDYKGEYILKFEAIPSSCDARSLAYCKFPYKVGDRVAQMYLEKVVQFEFEEVDELTTSERGTGGFGSTNK